MATVTSAVSSSSTAPRPFIMHPTHMPQMMPAAPAAPPVVVLAPSITHTTATATTPRKQQPTFTTNNLSGALVPFTGQQRPAESLVSPYAMAYYNAWMAASGQIQLQPSAAQPTAPTMMYSAAYPGMMTTTAPRMAPAMAAVAGTVAATNYAPRTYLSTAVYGMATNSSVTPHPIFYSYAHPASCAPLLPAAQTGIPPTVTEPTWTSANPYLTSYQFPSFRFEVSQPTMRDRDKQFSTIGIRGKQLDEVISAKVVPFSKPSSFVPPTVAVFPPPPQATIFGCSYSPLARVPLAVQSCQTMSSRLRAARLESTKSSTRSRSMPASSQTRGGLRPPQVPDYLIAAPNQPQYFTPVSVPPAYQPPPPPQPAAAPILSFIPQSQPQPQLAPVFATMAVPPGPTQPPYTTAAPVPLSARGVVRQPAMPTPLPQPTSTGPIFTPSLPPGMMLMRAAPPPTQATAGVQAAPSGSRSRSMGR